MSNRPPRKSIPTQKQKDLDAEQQEKKRRVEEAAFRKALRQHQEDEASAGYKQLPRRRQVLSVEPESEDDDDDFTSYNTNTFQSHPIVTSASRKQQSTTRNGEIILREPSQTLKASCIASAFPPRQPSEVTRRRSSHSLSNDDYYQDDGWGSPRRSSSPPRPPPPSSSPPPPSPRSSSPLPSSVLAVKRKEVPASSPQRVVLKKVKVPEPGGSRGRYRTSDFDGSEKLVLTDAQILFRVLVATKDAYPETSGCKDQFATESWIRSSLKRQLRLELVPAASLLITKRSSQMRGEIKTIARSIVETNYGICENLSKFEIRDQVEKLLDRYNYIYKDSAKRAGMYRHPAIQKTINKTWFRNSTDEGPSYSEFSDSEDGLPLETVALTLTAIHCALEEWVTGERKDVEFRASIYREHYLKHLESLRELEKHTQEEQIVPRLRQHWLRAARKHAKIAEPSTISNAPLTANDFEAAKAEWKDLQLDEDEV